MKRALSMLFLLTLAMITICSLAAAIPGCAAADHLAGEVVSATTPLAPGHAPTTAQAAVAGAQVVADAFGAPVSTIVNGGIVALGLIALGYQKVRSGKQLSDRDQKLAAYRDGLGNIANAGALSIDLWEQLHPAVKDHVAQSRETVDKIMPTLLKAPAAPPLAPQP